MRIDYANNGLTLYSMKDILLIDKPRGITSFDCIRILRKRFKRGTKIGHAGTLDPLATGLMIIGVGKETKRLGDYLRLSKTYEAEILLGVQTDTGDREGKIVESLQVGKLIRLNEEEITQILHGMIGKLQLPVPAYSAVKRGGEPLYKKARRGEKVIPPTKTMEVISVEFLGIADSENGHDRTHFLDGREVRGPIVKARFEVGSGTYIRSLAEEFGRRLGIPATLAALRRIRIGNFRIEDAESLNSLKRYE